ncbi:MAG: sulfotransferase family protein [Gammaproteobacteria bacterium]|nr:MAG: sulfotransferase family protein [Gammaproteobacteria bacterium]
MALAVLGVGWGRTATLSLKVALERLGFGPCYHMTELFEHPEHLPHWQRAEAGAPVDWADLFAGYRAAVDWPVCRHWRAIDAAFPDLKCVLTVRDPESWYDSVRATLYRARPGFWGRARVFLKLAFAPELRRRLPVFAFIERMLWQGEFAGRFDDRAFVLARYRARLEALRAALPAERLLLFDPAEGWAPLCAFLGVPVPDEPFPRLNARSDFPRLMARYL